MPENRPCHVCEAPDVPRDLVAITVTASLLLIAREAPELLTVDGIVERWTLCPDHEADLRAMSRLASSAVAAMRKDGVACPG